MSVIANYSINGANPVTVGGTGTAAKYFPNAPGASIGVANVTPSSTSAKGQLSVPGSSRLNGTAFHVQSSGFFEVDEVTASGTITLNLSANTGTISAPSYTILATSGAVTPANAGKYPWFFDVILQGDTTSGIVQGAQLVFVDNVAKSTIYGALTNALSGINFSTEPPFGLVMSVTFSASAANNTASMYQFQIQA